MTVTVHITVNGRAVARTVPAGMLLCDFLRDECGLGGTKEACGVGVCGACTVLVGDEPVSACLLLAPCADGAEVWTAEGIAHRSPDLARCFAEQEGLQCGICTPGQLVSAYALLRRHPQPDDARVAEWMSGTLCRCTGYASIRRAIAAAAAGPPAEGSAPGREADRAPRGAV